VCFAVGTATAGGAWSALIERWDGTGWSIQTIGSPGPWQRALRRVLPVRDVLHGSRFLRPEQRNSRRGAACFTWIGAAWTQEPAVLGPSESGVFRAVSCTSPGFCEAAGDTFTSSSSNTLAEGWNGSGFTRQLTAGLPPVFFLGVSCASTMFCVADGGESPFPGVTVPFVETFNGSGWAYQSATRTGQFFITPPAVMSSSLSSASCPSASACQVVGSFSNAGGSIFTPWAADLSGGSWPREANPYVFAAATFDAVS
jgi:hypothetical protein